MRMRFMNRYGAVAFVVSSLLATGCGETLESEELAPVQDVEQSVRCGTVAPAEVEPTERMVSAQRLPGTVRVPTYFHIIRTSTASAGSVSLARVQQQVDVLNAAFASTPFYFDLMGVNVTNNSTWYTMTQGSSAEMAAKNALRLGGKESLNIYTASPNGGLLGWTTFPSSYASNPWNDGVVLLHSAIAGGTLFSTPTEGDLVVHEVGHWLGLLHTSTGCTGNDGVADTPEAIPTSVCAEGRDSCSSPGLDPIHNYMNNATDEACMSEFTPGQAARMDSQALLYR